MRYKNYFQRRFAINSVEIFTTYAVAEKIKVNIEYTPREKIYERCSLTPTEQYAL